MEVSVVMLVPERSSKNEDIVASELFQYLRVKATTSMWEDLHVSKLKLYKFSYVALISMTAMQCFSSSKYQSPPSLFLYFVLNVGYSTFCPTVYYPLTSQTPIPQPLRSRLQQQILCQARL